MLSDEAGVEVSPVPQVHMSCSTKRSKGGKPRFKAVQNSPDSTPRGCISKQYKTRPARNSMHTFQSSTKLIPLQHARKRFKAVQNSLDLFHRGLVSKQYKTRPDPPALVSMGFEVV